MTSQNPRMFIGLELSMADKLSIGNWRDKQFGKELFGPFGKPVAMDNFHITLSFLGNVPVDKMEIIDLALQTISAESTQLIETTTSHLGVFIKPQVLYLGLTLSESLKGVAKQCRKINHKISLPQQHDEYRPHISLFRKHKSGTPIDVEPIPLSMTFTQLHLFESVSNASFGKSPKYVKRLSYPLSSKLR